MDNLTSARRRNDMETITKKDLFNDLKREVFDDKEDPEHTRVLAILDPIFSHLEDDTEMGYHFSEFDGHDEKHFEDLMGDLLEDEKWHTIYDSSYFPISDGGSYSIISVAYANSPDYFYLSASLGGCMGASALTEYFKVPMLGNKWSWSA
tara:strand:+ start:522 stop:971 length:450 start_codon:yes stop_codon:yes gene_type:complete